MQLQPKVRTPGELQLPGPANLEPYAWTHELRTEEQSALLHYWRILRKRAWYVFVVLAIAFVASVVVTFRTPRQYQATSTIAIFPDNVNVLGSKDGESAPSGSDADVMLQTQASILRSDTLALAVIDGMHLAQNAKFAGERAGSTSTSFATQGSADDSGLIQRFHGGLRVDLVPQTRIVAVSYTHQDPGLAKDIVNALTTAFIEQNIRTRFESVAQTSDWLSKELADLQLKVQTSEQKLVSYQKEHSILGVDEKQNIVTQKLDELNKELTSAQTERMQKESNYRFAMSGDPASDKLLAAQMSGLLSKLREKEADLNARYAELTTQFGTSYPKVVETSNQLEQVRADIATEQKRTRNQLHNEYLAALQRENLLSSAFEQQKKEANTLNESAIEYSVLKRDVDSNRQIYENLLQRLKEAGIAAGFKSSNIRVVDAARTPRIPVKPSLPRNLAFGLLAGLGGGIALALVMESLDTTVRNVDEMDAVCGLHNLAAIPLETGDSGRWRHLLSGLPGISKEAESPALVTCARPRSHGAESFRAFRTSLTLLLGSSPKVVLVTSALPQEGKSTVTANLGLVMALHGSRVLLVDADLRRPTLDRIFGVEATRGLSSLLAGKGDFNDLLVSLPVEGLSFLPAGMVSTRPTELLSSQVFKDCINRWRKEYDYVIVDAPSCLSVTDPVLVSSEVDGVVMVARAGQTTKTALRHAYAVLQQANARVIGTVLNGYDASSQDIFMYGGRYSHYYEKVES